MTDRRMPDDWAEWRRSVDLDAYDERWARMADAGENPHGEADLVSRLAPTSVLDAGCGTGRVGVELARRGVEVVGVDLDPDLLARARDKAPELTWVEADLSDMDLGRTFDVVVAAGNVLGFVAEPRRRAAVARCAGHVRSGGHLVVGWQLRPGWPTVADHDTWCASAGLVPVDHFATWAGEPLGPDPDYVVAVHHRPA
jgi:SAM-dependent methyltransferase